MDNSIILKLSSENANPKLKRNDCDFECILKKMMKNVIGIKLLDYSIPYTWYNLNNSNNTLYWNTLKDSSTNVYKNYTCVIDEGTYSIDELSNVIVEDMTNVELLDYLVTTNKIKWLYQEQILFTNWIQGSLSSLVLEKNASNENISTVYKYNSGNLTYINNAYTFSFHASLNIEQLGQVTITTNNPSVILNKFLTLNSSNTPNPIIGETVKFKSRNSKYTISITKDIDKTKLFKKIVLRIKFCVHHEDTYNFSYYLYDVNEGGDYSAISSNPQNNLSYVYNNNPYQKDFIFYSKDESDTFLYMIDDDIKDGYKFISIQNDNGNIHNSIPELNTINICDAYFINTNCYTNTDKIGHLLHSYFGNNVQFYKYNITNYDESNMTIGTQIALDFPLLYANMYNNINNRFNIIGQWNKLLNGNKDIEIISPKFKLSRKILSYRLLKLLGLNENNFENGNNSDYQQFLKGDNAPESFGPKMIYLDLDFSLSNKYLMFKNSSNSENYSDTRLPININCNYLDSLTNLVTPIPYYFSNTQFIRRIAIRLRTGDDDEILGGNNGFGTGGLYTYFTFEFILKPPITVKKNL